MGMSVDIGLTGVEAASQLTATVMTTSGRGFNPHEIGHMLLDKVFFVSQDLPPDALAKATEYRNNLYATFVHYLTMAQTSQNTTIYNVLENAGHHEAAELVKGL